jgi:hypothetical protein
LQYFHSFGFRVVFIILSLLLIGLNLTLSVAATWTQVKKLLTEVFKEYDLAKARFNNEKDLFGDGFMKDLAAYYFHLLLEDKPEAHKSITTMLNYGVFYVAGAPALGRWRLEASCCHSFRKKKNAAQIGPASMLMPLMSGLCFLLVQRGCCRQTPFILL